MEELTPFPLFLRYKLRILVLGPTVDKFICQITSSFCFLLSPFCFEWKQISVKSLRNSKETCFTKLSKFPALLQSGNMMGSFYRQELSSSTLTMFSLTNLNDFCLFLVACQFFSKHPFIIFLLLRMTEYVVLSKFKDSARIRIKTIPVETSLKNDKPLYPFWPNLPEFSLYT